MRGQGSIVGVGRPFFGRALPWTLVLVLLPAPAFGRSGGVSDRGQEALHRLVRSGQVVDGDRDPARRDEAPRRRHGNGVVFEGNFADLQLEHRREIVEEAMEDWRSMQRERKDLIIAIDGGAGVGKTSVAKILARDYGLLFVSTGEEYRALTAYLLDHGIEPDQEDLAAVLETIAVETVIEDGEAHLSFDGRLYGSAVLRGPDINGKVSAYAKNPALRSFLIRQQRAMLGRARRAGYGGIVIEGRDTTTAVFPMARFRFVLEASPAVRSQRRALEGIEEDLLARDRRDQRQMARGPGVRAVDTSELTLQEVVAVLKMAVDGGRGEP